MLLVTRVNDAFPLPCRRSFDVSIVLGEASRPDRWSSPSSQYPVLVAKVVSTGMIDIWIHSFSDENRTENWSLIYVPIRTWISYWMTFFFSTRSHFSNFVQVMDGVMAVKETEIILVIL